MEIKRILRKIQGGRIRVTRPRGGEGETLGNGPVAQRSEKREREEEEKKEGKKKDEEG